LPKNATAQMPSSSSDENLTTDESFRATQRRSEGGQLKLPSPAIQRPSLPDHTTPSRQIIKRDQLSPASRQVWRKRTEVELYQPYETDLDIMPPKPFSESHTRAMTVGEEQIAVIGSDPWETDRLPWHFRKTRPNIAGVVMHIEAKEEAIDYPDLFAAVATLLVELIWIMTNTVQERAGDRVVMTVIRVQTYDGSIKDARLRGHMRGANLSLGDKISLWGRKRHGVLFVRSGFNHTTRGVVSTRSIGLVVPALVFIIVLVVGVYFLPSWAHLALHALSSFFANFFSLFYHHPVSLPMQKKK
jgi:hypothetical protein